MPSSQIVNPICDPRYGVTAGSYWPPSQGLRFLVQLTPHTDATRDGTVPSGRSWPDRHFAGWREQKPKSGIIFCIVIGDTCRCKGTCANWMLLPGKFIW